MEGFVTRDLKANAEHTTQVGSARGSLVMINLEKEIHSTTGYRMPTPFES